MPLPPDRPAGLGGTAQRTVPLPPQRPAEFGGGGQVTAEVKSPVPVSVTGQATLTHTITLVPSPLFDAKITGLTQQIMSLKGQVASNGPGSTGKSSPDAGTGSRD